LHFTIVVVTVGLLDIVDVVDVALVVPPTPGSFSTPQGPAIICTIFLIVALKTAGARASCLLLRSYITYILVRIVSPIILPSGLALLIPNSH